MITQEELIKEFFLNHQNEDISHEDIVPWLMSEYLKRTGNPFRDPDRGIRLLSQKGFLIKVKKGVYKYDPNAVGKSTLSPFSELQKKQILERDGYKCVICGKGIKDGVELQVDHIKPQQFGGKNEIDNGQTLCAQHNFQKKVYNQTESGKKMFIRLYELAKMENDLKLLEFVTSILETFETHNINGHIEWKK